MNTQPAELTAELKETQLLKMRERSKKSVRNLTKREIAVLARLTPKCTLEEIAAELYVSRNTVKSQIRSAYKKLGSNKRENAITWVAHTVNRNTL